MISGCWRPDVYAKQKFKGEIPENRCFIEGDLLE